MSACTSPTCYGVPAHIAVDVTPKPERIVRGDFCNDEAEGHINGAKAYRDCARLGLKCSIHRITRGESAIRVSPRARRIMLAWMRSEARWAIDAVRRQKGLAKKSW